MKHDPVRPAPLDDVGGHLVVSAYRDRVEASAVGEFLTGNDLPGRWRGRARYVVLATGFGTGAAFLRTWRTWRDDPSRCERLVFLAVEPRPLGRDDLQRWHAAQSPSDDTPAALCTAWPALTPDLHRLSFDADRVQLLLAFGALRRWLPEWVAAVDGFYLDGMGGAADADASEDARRFVDTARQCKALARLAARGAALAAPRPAPQLAGPLRGAGFEVGPTPPGEPLQARYA
ncbi:MAG: MnmC family methyltransferase, partial [Pseudomonadota bacterium]|nr:MnmC family methyltransferase [Pseudomonadota bacterium]